MVLGDREGVFFIPPHLVQEVVDAADVTHLHDEWTRKKFDEGKYKSADIYGRPRDPVLIQGVRGLSEAETWGEEIRRIPEGASRPGGRRGLRPGRAAVAVTGRGSLISA